jgi:hypothetical protein
MNVVGDLCYGTDFCPEMLLERNSSGVLRGAGKALACGQHLRGSLDFAAARGTRLLGQFDGGECNRIHGAGCITEQVDQ